MPIRVDHECGAVWLELTNLDGGPDFPICTIWDDGEIILEASESKGEFIYPTLEEWKFLAKVVKTNIKRLKKENDGG